MNLLTATWHHIRRSPFQSLVAVFVMTANFLVLSVFAITSVGLSSVLNYFETKPEITIFLKDGLDKSTVESIQQELTSYPGIREIRFISKEKALNIYREQNKDNPLLLEMVTASALPASFEVSASDPKILSDIAQNFSPKTNLIDEIVYQKDIVDWLLKWTSVIRKIGIILVSFFCLVAFSVIFVIIGMKITNRKDEIKISRLLGASKFYVKRPFLLEGMFYGLVGSSLGWFVATLTAFYFRPAINSFFGEIVFISHNYVFYLLILTAEIILGTFIGYFASWFGAKRYIKF